MSLQRTLESLSRCNCVANRRIYLVVDGMRDDNPGDVTLLHEVLKVVEYYKSRVFPHLILIVRDRNLGCAKNVSLAISEVLSKYESVIVVEDDLLVSKTFLEFMDTALDFYRDDGRFWCINGHLSPFFNASRTNLPDVFPVLRNNSWGWAIWKDRWECTDLSLPSWNQKKNDTVFLRALDLAGFDLRGLVDAQSMGALDSWAVPCTYHMVCKGLWAVQPKYTLVKNIGFVKSATHTNSNVPMITKQKYYNFKPIFRKDVTLDYRAIEELRRPWFKKNLLGRIVWKLERLSAVIRRNYDGPLDLQ